jgi:hypothetical protein
MYNEYVTGELDYHEDLALKEWEYYLLYKEEEEVEDDEEERPETD